MNVMNQFDPTSQARRQGATVAALVAGAASLVIAASTVGSPPPPTAPPASSPPPATAPPAATPPTADRPKPKPNPKSIDEILGTRGGAAAPKETDKTTETPAAPPVGETADETRQRELRRALTEQEAGEAFAQAVVQMSRSASLLGESLDPGIDTQRIQEDVLAKLDLLLKQPSKKSKSSSSSSSQSASQSQDPKKAPPKAGEQQGQQQQEGARSEKPASESNEAAGGVPRQEGALEQSLEGSGAEWGNLPARVRDMIRQGLRDRPSSLYQRLTEEYYRRLAEDSSR